MKLNLASLAFNLNIESGGGTPTWGTEMGQGEGYKFSFEDMPDFFTGMVYKSVPANKEDIYCPLGKGGASQNDYEYVIASVFDKIYVNGVFVPDSSFMLLVVKKMVGDNHVGRRSLKYNPRQTYRGDAINESCYRAIEDVLGISHNSGWFVDEINIKNEDELHFTAYVLDGTQPVSFPSNEDRKRAMRKLLNIKDKPVNVKEALELLKQKTDKCLQLIFYGAPGTGKSYTVDNDTEPRRSVRTTFHPDSDYASFVGTYKPTIGDEPMSYISEGLAKYAKAWGNHPAKERKITYKFVPQAFMKAYVSAWKDLENPHYLIIEEINRGNCAQIFGDLFQLLDRNADGYSSYPVTADEDIRQYICDTFSKESESLKGLISSVSIVNCKGSEIVNGLEILSGEKLLLPPNLHIWATMNTSDQSLFPIDSAFKRRWDWKYVPINYDAETWMLNVDGKRYRWGDFLRAINPIITSVTESHDKQMGYFFVRSRDGEVSAETFLNKVLFYLWADVFKDFGLEHPVFRNETAQRPYEFSDFFRIDGTPDEAVIDSFLGNISEFYADNKDINLTPVSSVE